MTTPILSHCSSPQNLYVCEYNRWRLRHNPAEPRFRYHPNIVKNNIVPIPPSLDKVASSSSPLSIPPICLRPDNHHTE